MSILIILDTRFCLLATRSSVWLKQDFRIICTSCNLFGISSRVHFINFTNFYQKGRVFNKAGEWKVHGFKYQPSTLSEHRIFKFSTKSSKGKILASNSMSRIKNTLNSVSKAVSSTHNEIVSRISRPKPNPATIEKSENVQTNFGNATESESSDTKTDTNSKVHISEPSNIADSTSGNLRESSANFPKENNNLNSGLFHVGYITTNFGESYNILAGHINRYFGSETSMEKTKTSEEVNNMHGSSSTDEITEKEKDLDVPISDPTNVSAKKSISNFITNQSNNVQAFVGSYFGGLVPKMRSETKNAIDEKEQKPEEIENKSDQETSKDAKSSEDRAKRLSLQREKIIARVSVDNRTRALVQSLRRATDRRLCISRVEELSCHLLEFPETRGVAVKEKVIPCLLRLRQAHDETLQAAVREALALIGYINPVKGRGIRILTIDGGGTRGLVALQTLRKLEEMTGKPVHQLFDYICGVSTGAILGFMLGLFHIPLDECEELYRKLGRDVFKQNVIVGTVKMSWSHSYYNSEMWESMLKERMGSDLMIETARNPLCPKVAAVSTIVNRGLPLKAFVFRNYNHFPGVKMPYLGGCQYNLWQAIRASSAAPGYFQEYVLGNDLHQDGGLLINNPCALALHECKSLWPNVPVQCVISLGTGRYECAGKSNVTSTSLKTKLTNVISSATDTEDGPIYWQQSSAAKVSMVYKGADQYTTMHLHSPQPISMIMYTRFT
ncbi:calcium-independent phospholipase A2-gamma [Bombina bombina]|uniref:calcium-independent phospholipase A2-gamma n=1 Tax=Bombina bombina TaxID=8345 RepID=UPI00235A5CC8|nr:calcium-independent phospholipase A2-gamma [Bombina bombina]